MRLKWPATAYVSDRFGISDRATAAIESRVLEDLGLIKEGVNSSSRSIGLVVDNSKIRCENRKFRNTIQNVKELDIVKDIYFDGQKYNTLV